MNKRIYIIITFLLTMLGAKAEDKPYNGLVTNNAGEPLKGVRVWVHNEASYARSDKKGRFGLTNVEPTDTLHLKYGKTLYVIPVEGKKSARIMLADQSATMDEDQELVDIGYGYVKRRECNISTAGISGEELVKTGQSSILAALEGRIPGLSISAGSRPGDEAEVLIRGRKSLYGSNEPLYIVDGVIVDSLDFVSIYDVDHVEVLRDAAIYGSRGANGAIIVHTKQAGR